MSREEILADFQACTGIDDFGLVIHHLEEVDWVLTDAVNKAIPGESYQSQISVERAEEKERTERNHVKDEQEKAFQEAQIRDQER